MAHLTNAMSICCIAVQRQVYDECTTSYWQHWWRSCGAGAGDVCSNAICGCGGAQACTSYSVVYAYQEPSVQHDDLANVNIVMVCWIQYINAETKPQWYCCRFESDGGDATAGGVCIKRACATYWCSPVDEILMKWMWLLDCGVMLNNLGARGRSCTS